MSDQKARGIYRLYLESRSTGKKLAIPIYERDTYRTHIDIVTIDHFLFSEEIRSHDHRELRDHLCLYVTDLLNQLDKVPKWNKEQRNLAKQCRELAEELRLVEHNYSFFIEGNVPSKEGQKKYFPVLYQPTDMLFYFNDFYFVHGQGILKDEVRRKVRHEQAWQLLANELISSLTHDYAIYKELYNTEHNYLYRLFEYIKSYKVYSSDPWHDETKLAAKDAKNKALEQLSFYQSLRAILNHDIILQNPHINNLNVQLLLKDEHQGKSVHEKDMKISLDETFSIYDLSNVPENIKPYIDGSGYSK